LLKPHFDADAEFVVSRNQSRHGKYQSLTIRFTAQSRQQLDAIYQSLTDCEQVVMSL
jgi:putative lipoic acid-binding regulatory protein